MSKINKFIKFFVCLAAIIAIYRGVLYSATGTLVPTAYQTLLDANGNPINNGKVCTYLAGTSTLTATYTDVNLSVANANPIRTDSAGRWVAYLSPGVSYKLVFQDSTGTAGNCDGAAIKTQDNVSAVPASASNIDVTGTAGEALTAGQAVYLSDGSGGKNAGQWYKADNTQAYSSSVPQVGIVPANISSGASGTVRIAGSATGLSSLTVGSTYYIGTGGAVTLTAPVQRRFLGVADTTTTLILAPNPAAAIVQPWTNDFRLTLTTATPVTTADVTAATTIYCSPLTGNRLDLPDSNGNPQRVTSAEFSIAVPASTSQVYDVFAYLNGAVATLELLAWTNDTTRATATVRTTNGRWLKSGDNTRLYLGSVRTTAVSGQTEDSAAKRYLWNYYNRKRRVLQKFEGASSWNYTTATIRQANGSTANQVDAVFGQVEDPLELVVATAVINTTTAAAQIGIGVDSTTAFSTGNFAGYQRVSTGVSTNNVQIQAWFRAYPTVGRHVYSWNEYSEAAGTTTWNANTNAASTPNSGIQGWIEG